MLRPLYRSRQVWHALAPRIEPEALDFARETLSEAEWRLFDAMERRDQRHALEVALRLREKTDERGLLVAALLHDCGKGDVPVWLRSLNVLSPGAVGRIASKTGGGWRIAAFRLRHHVELSAELAQAAGCDPTTVRLIYGRVEPGETWQLDLLLAADDAS